MTLAVLCNPHNPVGRVWTRTELQEIGEIMLANDILVVADEIHSDLTMRGHRYTPYAAVNQVMADNSITCFAATESFNLACPRALLAKALDRLASTVKAL